MPDCRLGHACRPCIIFGLVCAIEMKGCDSNKGASWVLLAAETKLTLETKRPDCRVCPTCMPCTAVDTIHCPEFTVYFPPASSSSAGWHGIPVGSMKLDIVWGMRQREAWNPPSRQRRSTAGWATHACHAPQSHPPAIQYPRRAFPLPAPPLPAGK